MNLINLGIFIGTSALILVLIVLTVVLAVKNRKLTRRVGQTELDKFFILAHLDKVTQESENKTIEESDGFIKFISESRDWAFQYIEDIQNALRDYDQVASKIPINREITIGLADDYSNAYKKLIDYLPKEEESS